MDKFHCNTFVFMASPSMLLDPSIEESVYTRDKMYNYTKACTSHVYGYIRELLVQTFLAAQACFNNCL